MALRTLQSFRSISRNFSTLTQAVEVRKYTLPEPIDVNTTYRFNLKPEQVAGQPEMVKKTLLLQNGSKFEVTKAEIQNIIKSFERFPGDTGSSEVQIAVLTTKIKALTEHARQHPKDHNTKRGLVATVNKRKKLLKYLKRTKFQVFKQVVAALGLRY